jgi:hypothetical protein
MKSPKLSLSQFSKSKTGVYVPCNEGPIGAHTENRIGRWHQTIYRCDVCGDPVCPRHQRTHAQACGK